MSGGWTEDENRAVVNAYMAIVESDMAGTPLTKTWVYARLASQLGRAPKAIEYKMLNVSGALQTLGFGFARGLAPAANYQKSLLDVVGKEIAGRPEVQAYLESRAEPPVRTDSGIASMIDSSPQISQQDGALSMHVQDLWQLGTGGSDVAALPGSAQTGPRGPSPAAVDQGVAWIEAALQGRSETKRMLFLVGGPGGGKSFVASRITSSLPRSDGPEDGLAHRQYTFGSQAGPLLLINDATIPPDRAAGGAQSLADDVSSHLGQNLIACVNRGVLVDEQTSEDPATAGALVTRWLRRSADHETVGNAQFSLRTTAQTEYARQATLQADGSTIELMAIFVDTCSLFEPAPSCRLTPEGSLVGDSYALEGFSTGAHRLATPAGTLLTSVVETLSWRTDLDWDPIAANLAALSAPDVRNGLLALLRGAEIISSQRLTYRELWGTIARCVAGPLPEQLPTDQLDEWFRSNATEPSDDSIKLFEKMRRLASYRFSQALFDDSHAKGSRHPVLRILSAADPARDMVPGHPQDKPTGWATPVIEAFSSAELGDSPLDVLQTSAQSRSLDAAITRFEHLLDQAYVNAMHQSSDSRWRSDATAWYGTYLARLFGICHGVPAFLSDIHAWVEAWRLSPAIPEILRHRLETLISPPREPESRMKISQVPLFAARTEALRGRPDSPILAFALEDMDLQTQRDGETLLLKVSRRGEEVGVVPLDLQLTREAMACAQGWVGMTDATDSSVPRLERFRSLQLLPRHRGANSVQIVGPANEYQLSIGDQERAWRVH